MEEQSISSKLAEMYELHKAGALTKEEFEQMKKQLLTQDVTGNIGNVKKQEKRNILPQNKAKQSKKATRIMIIAFLSSVFIFGVFLVLKTVAFSGKSESTIRIKNMKLNANLLPPAGLYIWNNGRGYKEYIRVIIVKGEMTIQQGEKVNNLENLKTYSVDDDGTIEMGPGDSFKYEGNGVIGRDIHGATSDAGPTMKYIKKE
jgi:hypothetical protein